ncbi:MAG: response regulator transcription factor [Chitinophagaceae bacterium]|nr:response regulator transcription factor [Chitinophagaceae bacterium]
MGLKKHKLLVVCDSSFICNHLKHILSTLDANVHVKEVNSFTETARMLDKEKPHVIILDIPVIQSSELGLLSVIKDLYPDVSIVILMGSHNKIYLEQSRKIGSGYFIKNIHEIEGINEIAGLENSFKKN